MLSLKVDTVTITNFNWKTKNRQTQINDRGCQIQIGSWAVKYKLGLGVMGGARVGGLETQIPYFAKF